MSADLSVAKRYAKAAFDAVGAERAETLVASLSAFAQQMENHRELRDAFFNPAVSDSEKKQVLNDIASALHADLPETKRLLELLLENKRLLLVREIASELDALAKAYKKLLSVEVTTARAVSQSERDGMLEKLRADFGSLLEVSWKEDQSIIGGMRVQCGDTVLDASVRGGLEKMRTQLIG
jgi:F-type H+-transporting ATPase subunit delta